MEFYDVLFNRKYGRRRGGFYAQLFADAKESVYKTVSGDIINITDAAGGAPKSLSIAINPVQEGSGTPSPENVRNISGHYGVELTLNGDDFPVSWETEAGTVYGGRINLVTGLLTVDKVVLDYPTLEGMATGQNFIGSKYRLDLITEKDLAIDGMTTSATNPCECLCNIAPTNFSWNSFSTLPDRELAAFVFKYYNWQETRVYMSIPDTSITTKEQAQRWLYANNFKICYKLKNARTYQLTPEQIQLLAGSNSLQADTGDVTLTYKVRG